MAGGAVLVSLFAGRPEIEKTIFGQRRRQRIRIAMIKAERESMERIGNFITVVRQL